MHVVCRYPLNSTRIKAIKADNFIGWPMLIEINMARYYPETNETPKGHLNKPRKNVQSTKPKRTPLRCPKQERYKDTRYVYGVRNTLFSDQTGKFPTRSQQGNMYIMVMVDINSNVILVEPIKTCKDEDLTQSYQTMMLRLQRAGIITKNHILDNEVSQSLKKIIQDEYKIQIELVPPGTHRKMQQMWQ